VLQAFLSRIGSLRSTQLFGLSKALASLVFAVNASDPATLADVTLIFGCVSLAALYFPARRATRIDPLVILRTD